MPHYHLDVCDSDYSSVNSAAFSPDGSRIVTASSSEELRAASNNMTKWLSDLKATVRNGMPRCDLICPDLRKVL